MGESSGHFLTFTAQSGNEQILTFSGTATEVGNHQLLLTAREPGAEYPMDTITVVVMAQDSNAPVVIEDQTQSTIMVTLANNTMFQAALAGLVLFVLMGTLVLRGQSKNLRENERRMTRANEIRQQRGISESPVRSMVQDQRVRSRERGASIFDDFRRR